MILFMIALLIYIIYRIIKNKSQNSSADSTVSLESDLSNQPKPNFEDGLIKRINFNAVGLDYDRDKKNGRKVLSDCVKFMRKEELFYYDKYDGMTNKEIKEEYFQDRVYELSYESLPFCSIVKEDDNEYDPLALRVVAGLSEDNMQHIGYVPKEYCKEIRELMSDYQILIGNTIYGGKYKYVDYDDYGEEKVKINSTQYGLKIFVSFWDKSKDLKHLN